MAQPKRSKKTGRFLKTAGKKRTSSRRKTKKPVRRNCGMMKGGSASKPVAVVTYTPAKGKKVHAVPCKTKAVAASWAKAYGYDPKKKNVRVRVSIPKAAKVHGKKMVGAKLAYWRKLAK